MATVIIDSSEAHRSVAEGFRRLLMTLTFYEFLARYKSVIGDRLSQSCNEQVCLREIQRKRPRLKLLNVFIIELNLYVIHHENLSDSNRYYIYKLAVAFILWQRRPDQKHPFNYVTAY